MDKSALITGITGQDGAYLAKFLLNKGYNVYGTYRRLSTPNFWRLQYLEIFEKLKLIPVDLIDAASIIEAIKISHPDEVYHLAAQSFVGASFEQPIGTADITGVGTTRVLEAIRHVDTNIKIYQASTSELYGNSSKMNSSYSENSPFKPASPYAAAKLYAYWTIRIYREAYGIFAVNGILFNHESPLRGLEFVTRKITNTVARIALGLEDSLILGNLQSKRDWGYAPEFVESMWLMLQHDKPEDFVVATGEAHSVQEFVEKSFEIVNLDWQDYVVTDKKYNRPLDVNYLQGDYTKASKLLGWKAKVKFNQLVEIMTKADIERWERWQNGQNFPWDAQNYPSDANIVTRSLRF